MCFRGRLPKRLPRWGGWADDSSPTPVASREIPAARCPGMRLIEIKLRLADEGDGLQREMGLLAYRHIRASAYL